MLYHKFTFNIVVLVKTIVDRDDVILRLVLMKDICVRRGATIQRKREDLVTAERSKERK